MLPPHGAAVATRRGGYHDGNRVVRYMTRRPRHTPAPLPECVWQYGDFFMQHMQCVIVVRRAWQYGEFLCAIADLMICRVMLFVGPLNQNDAGVFAGARQFPSPTRPNIRLIYNVMAIMNLI